MFDQIKQSFLDRLPQGAVEYRNAVEAAFRLPTAFAPKMEVIKIDRRYTPEGRRAAAKSELSGSIAEMQQLRSVVKRENAALANRRAQFVLPAPDRADVFGEMQRAELRTVLRSMPIGDRIAHALSDPAFREAALNAPASLSGLSQAKFKDVLAIALEAAHGPALKALAAEQSVVDELDGALKIAVMHLEKVAEVDLPELKD